MDKIIISDLEIFAYHGVLPAEKKNGQTFIVTAELYVNLHDAGKTDDLNKTINYAQVCEDIRMVMLEKKYNLIEAAAENIAQTILKKYKAIDKVRILLKKPGAPIDMVFDAMCVDIIRGRHTVYLGIGSNLGDKKGYLDFAVDRLNADDDITVNKVSEYIITEPYGGVSQDDFLNACVGIETLYTPAELLTAINAIEKAAGRERIIRWGPRTLDIDILLYDNEIIMEENLKIPHIEMTKREFVLKPLCEIAPYAVNPVCNRTVQELYRELLLQ